MRRGLFLIVMVMSSALVLTATASPRPLEGGGTAPPDPAGDSGVAPDITAVSMSNDNAGKLTWRITLANRSQFLAPDFVSIYIDADYKDTGENGFEFLLQADSAQGPALFKWVGNWLDTQSKSVSSSFANGVLEISLDFRELDSELFLFWIYSDTVPADSDEQWDEAPNTGSYAYFADVPLLLDSFTKPARVSAGKSAKLSLSAWTNNSSKPKVTCTGRIGSAKVKGKAVSAIVSITAPAGDGQLVVTAYQAAASCSFAAPRSARGKTLSGRITVSKGGVSISRTLTAKVR